MFDRLEPPAVVDRYFDEIGTYTTVTRVFRPRIGWTALRGPAHDNQITTTLCCQLANEGVTAVEVGGWRHPDRQAWADFHITELINQFDLLAHDNPCTTH